MNSQINNSTTNVKEEVVIREKNTGWFFSSKDSYGDGEVFGIHFVSNKDDARKFSANHSSDMKFIQQIIDKVPFELETVKITTTFVTVENEEVIK